MAKSYLRYGAFSRSGLIEQLEYEGFPYSDAIFGVDHSEANWEQQAVEMAKSYLKFSSFSRSGLIEQLKYEGFTHAQAIYGVDNSGFGSDSESNPSNNSLSNSFSQQNAVNKAKSYLMYSAFSRNGLIEQLEYEGFSTFDATYGVNHCDANWNEQAVEKAKSYLTYGSFSRSDLIDQLNMKDLPMNKLSMV